MEFIKQLLRWPVSLLVKSKLIQAPEDGRQIDVKKPIIYLLKTQSGSDLIALEQVTKRAKLPSPFSPLLIGGEEFPRAIALEKTQLPFSSGKKARKTDAESTFRKLFYIQKSQPETDVQILPVAVFWGRAPGQASNQQEKLFWGVVTSPSWLSKLFVVLFSGRNNFVVFSSFVSSLVMTTEKSTDETLAHKLIRVARVHFRRKEAAALGPTEFNRQQLYFRIMNSTSVKQALLDEAGAANISEAKAKQLASQYFEEIAADFRPGFLVLFGRVLTLLWNKIYSGIKVLNFDRVRQVAEKGHEIIYVPCHRSHIDYLLLTYVIYHQGLMTPHIAAGVNLNFWPAGTIFRRSGAFFIRRSFKGNRLYTAVFREYLDQLFNLGYPVKYFCEGGRSRTGRLLSPKTGMLAMTLQSVLRGVERPISFVPVYIGYEHVMEVASYLKELSGNEKKNESVAQVFGAVKKLRNFGKGYVSFGQPLSLNQFLNEEVENWSESVGKDATRPAWLTPAVNQLAYRIQVGINKAVATNPVALVATCILAADKRALSRKELLFQLDLYLNLLGNVTYSDSSYISSDNAEELLTRALAHNNKFEVVEDKLGDIIRLDANAAIAMTYYRNNIKHLFLIPGLVAAMVLRSKSVDRAKIKGFINVLYPLLQKEWFIEVNDIDVYVEEILSEFKQQRLISSKGKYLQTADIESTQFFALALLAKSVQDTLQRYAIVLSVIDEQQNISRTELEQQSQVLAQRLSALHGIKAPEFFDKKVIASKIMALKEQLLNSDTEGNMKHSEQSLALMHQVLALLDFDVRQTICG